MRKAPAQDMTKYTAEPGFLLALIQTDHFRTKKNKNKKKNPNTTAARTHKDLIGHFSWPNCFSGSGSSLVEMLCSLLNY